MSRFAAVSLSLVALAACSRNEAASNPASAGTPAAATKPSPLPPMDANNVVSIASNSKDHTTLVKALQAADYVASLASPGPFTVFAPTDAAFAKLPAGTLDSLLQPDHQGELKEVIKYHATTTVYEQKDLKDGQVLGMANGAKVTIHVKDGKVTVNDANVVASVRGSNGIVHVIDAVLLPPKK